MVEQHHEDPKRPSRATLLWRTDITTIIKTSKALVFTLDFIASSLEEEIGSTDLWARAARANHLGTIRECWSAIHRAVSPFADQVRRRASRSHTTLNETREDYKTPGAVSRVGGGDDLDSNDSNSGAWRMYSAVLTVLSEKVRAYTCLYHGTVHWTEEFSDVAATKPHRVSK